MTCQAGRAEAIESVSGQSRPRNKHLFGQELTMYAAYPRIACLLPVKRGHSHLFAKDHDSSNQTQD
jgi:hypothetical protein